MNCVVMGGGGFIGSHLSEALIEKYDKVTVFDRPGASYLQLLSQKGAKIVQGNFLESTHLQEALVGADTLFHLISTTVPKSSMDNPVFDIESNLIGSINLLDQARNAGVKKIIYASSGGTVYGVPQQIPISEDHTTAPICSYGIVKLAIEKYLHLYWTLFGLDYCVLRVSNAYGERQIVNSAQGVIPVLIDKELHKQRFTIWGDGSVVRDYIHVSDIVSAFLKASEHSGEPRIFNIGSGIGHSVNDIAKTLESLLDKKLDIIYNSARAFDVPINILNVSLAKSCLGWEPKMALSEGLRQTVDYMRRN